jgi:hypothetical protein
MTIEFKEGRYIAAIAFIGSDEHPRDWMATLWKDAEGPWRCDYRFRYYKDDKSFDSEDEKNWYAFAAPDDWTKERAVAFLKSMADQLVEKGFGSELSWLTPDSDNPDLILHLLSQQKWANVKHQKIGDLPS